MRRNLFLAWCGSSVISLVACGQVRTDVDDVADTQQETTVTTESNASNVENAVADISEPGSEPAHEFECDLGGAVSSATHVTRAPAGAAFGEDWIGEDGRRLQALDVPGAVVVAATGNEVNDDPALGDYEPDFERQALFSYSQFVNADALEDLEGGETLVLVSHVALISRQEPGVYATLLVAESEDGAARLLGPCGNAWQPAFESAAADLDRTLDASFLIAVTNWESDEASLVNAYYGGATVPDLDRWDSTPAESRDLSIAEIPMAVRPKYKLVGLLVDVDSSAPAGFLSLRSGQGVSVTLALGPAQGLLAVAVPRKDVAMEIVFIEDLYATPDGQRVLATVDSSRFDEFLGSRISIRGSTRDGLSADVQVLDAGELEVASGLTRSEIEAYRERLYSTE